VAAEIDDMASRADLEKEAAAQALLDAFSQGE
jgi:hypothetical protein